MIVKFSFLLIWKLEAEILVVKRTDKKRTLIKIPGTFRNIYEYSELEHH